MSLPSNTLTVLLDHLREHEPPFVLASPDDANFFRAGSKKKEEVKKVEQPPKPVVIVEKPAPPPKPVVAVEKPIPPKPVVVEDDKPEPRPEWDFAGVRNVVSVVAPELLILNEIPNDIMAQKISERWKTKNQTAPISILSFQEPPEQRALLEGVVRALDVYFGPAKLINAEGIEKDKQWEAFLSVADLKMVIVCDYTLWQLNGLMQFYKETPAQGLRMVGNTPLFLLPDLSLYLKDPLLKRSLWKALCQKFS